MLTSGISFVNFNKKNKSLRLRRNLQSIINDKNEILNSLSKNYRDTYKKDLVGKYKVFSNYRVIGMGGSILGTRTIYEFLVEKKSPLVMPPDYNDLPVPDQNKEKAETNQNKIKDLVTKNDNENGENNNSKDGNLDIEQSILKKIKN